MDLFKKYSKYIILGVITLVITLVVILGSFIISKTFANPTIEVVKYVETDYSNSYVILYSNNDLYVKNNSSNDESYEVFKNVVDVFSISDNIFYLDSEKNLYRVPYSNEAFMENVKNIIESTDGYSSTFMIITEDDKLYAHNWWSSPPAFLENKESDNGLYYLFDNVKDCKFNSGNLLVRDNNNTLYAMGNNYYGKKINEGNYLSDFTKIMDNVVQYDYNYALDSNGNLYMFDYAFSEPTLVTTNVSKFNTDGYTLIIKDTDDKSYYVFNRIEENILNVETYEVKIDNIISEDTDMDIYPYSFNLIKDSTLYNVGLVRSSDGKYKSYYKKIIENVKNVKNSCILTNDNTLYGYESCISYQMPKEYYGNNIYKVMDNVKDISYIDNNVIIMEDDTVWMYGENEDNKFNDSSIVRSNIPVLVKGLPNAPESISVYDINLITLKKTDFTVGTTFDYYVNVFPYNAVNREVVWKSSNEGVATVSDNGKITAISEGKATISVETVDGIFKEEVEITVYPIVSGVEILNGDNLDLALHEEVILTAKVSPDNTLEKDLEWTVSDENAIYIYIDNYTEVGRETLPSNQRRISVRKGGTYTVTVTTKNGLYSDTITINTVEKVNNISLNIDEDHFDGSYNAFIYLDESDKLEVDYEITPESATNKNLIWTSSNPEVAEVSNNGVITGKKVGKTKITVESEDGNVRRSFNLLVYNYNKNSVTGDANGDGKVNIMDVIKLRRYLAGLEELE